MPKREMYVRHLAQAESAIALGREHIAKQRAIVAELQTAGHDISEATDLLDTLLTSQNMHEQHRAKILKELEEAGG